VAVPRQTGQGSGRSEGSEGSEGGRERRSFLLRHPPDLLSEQRSWAGHELRSLNAHIEYLLREALKRRKGREE
jgi:hypothetical protein